MDNLHFIVIDHKGEYKVIIKKSSLEQTDFLKRFEIPFKHNLILAFGKYRVKEKQLMAYKNMVSQDLLLTLVQTEVTKFLIKDKVETFLDNVREKFRDWYAKIR